jgi:hypothetical protein
MVTSVYLKKPGQTIPQYAVPKARQIAAANVVRAVTPVTLTLPNPTNPQYAVLRAQPLVAASVVIQPMATPVMVLRELVARLTQPFVGMVFAAASLHRFVFRKV